MLHEFKGKDIKGKGLIRCVCVVGLFLTAAGCANHSVTDLEQFVEETRQAQKGRIEPLPQFKPYETFMYSAAALRPPFSPWQDGQDKAGGTRTAGAGPQPDFNRRKELLEKFPLDSLRMVGTLAREEGEGNWAIVQAPDGMVYRVREGNYLGQNHGQIKVMGTQRIEVRELVPDGLGGWQERQAFLTLEE